MKKNGKEERHERRAKENKENNNEIKRERNKNKELTYPITGVMIRLPVRVFFKKRNGFFFFSCGALGGMMQCPRHVLNISFYSSTLLLDS